MTSRSLRVLMYHRVLDPAESSTRDPALISATPEAFERQMRHLSRWYTAVSEAQLLQCLREGTPLPPRAVLVTFDDACRDFADTAWPIMRRYGVPATVFVPTAYPDAPHRQFWWDRLHRAVSAAPDGTLQDLPCPDLPSPARRSRAAVLRSLQRRVKSLPHDEAMQLVEDVCAQLHEPAPEPADVLGWDDLRRLAAEGVSIGAHTRTHPALTRLPVDRAREEIEGSRQDVAREIGVTPALFSYPFGDHHADVADIVRRAGFEAAVTCRTGLNAVPGADPMLLRRCNISRRTSFPLFAMRMTTAGAFVDGWRNRHKDLPTEPVSGQVRDGVPGSARAKVGYVMSRFPKLSETFVLNEMIAMERQGAHVELYPVLRERQPTEHPEVHQWMPRARFESLLSARVVRAHVHYALHRPAAYFGMLRDVLWGTLGSLNFFVGALGTIPKAVAFARDAEARHLTHVHAHFATHPALAAFVINRLTGIPFSFTAHGSDLHVDRTMLPAKVAAASFVVAISAYNRRIIVDDCGPAAAAKTLVIHCGVDPHYFRPATPPGRGFEFACVASFERVKGHAFLLEACRILRSRGVDFRCHLVGDGPLRREIVEQIHTSGLESHVVVHGGLPRPEVASLLGRMHAAVLASHPTPEGKREGIPVALMEAMASSLPVVATAISGIPELVEDESSGLLVPSGDPEALADALRRLRDDPALRQRLGRAARTRVCEHFDLYRNAGRLLDVITGPRHSPAAERPLAERPRREPNVPQAVQ